jgi:hypothetical protein
MEEDNRNAFLVLLILLELKAEEEEATTRVVVVGAVSLKEKEIHRYF